MSDALLYGLGLKTNKSCDFLRRKNHPCMLPSAQFLSDPLSEEFVEMPHCFFRLLIWNPVPSIG